MSTYEPSTLEMMLTVALGKLAANIYKDYVDTLVLSGDERVLDFGSGSGNPALYLAPILETRGGRLTCVDVSHRWMQLARWRLRQFPNVDYRLGEIGRLDIPPASQDIVLIHFVLHDIPPVERPAVMRELSTRLVASGRLFIREPLRFIAEDEILELMEQNGLKEVSSSAAGIVTQGFVYAGVFSKNGKAHPVGQTESANR